MKNTGNDIDYLSIMEGYTDNQSEMPLIKEEVAPYLSSKQQGEYTLDDYYAIPDEYRVELIDGVIYDMASPRDVHQIVSNLINLKIFNYIEKKNGKCIIITAPMDVQLDRDDRTIVQPDILVVCDRKKFVNGRIYGAPDFIVEVLSPATRKKDIRIKTSKYRKAGVREYWIVDIEKEQVITHLFEESELAVLYTFKDKVDVGIFDKECRVDFAEIAEKISFLKEAI